MSVHFLGEVDCRSYKGTLVQRDYGGIWGEGKKV